MILLNIQHVRLIPSYSELFRRSSDAITQASTSLADGGTASDRVSSCVESNDELPIVIVISVSTLSHTPFPFLCHCMKDPLHPSHAQSSPLFLSCWYPCQQGGVIWRLPFIGSVCTRAAFYPEKVNSITKFFFSIRDTKYYQFFMFLLSPRPNSTASKSLISL